MGHSLGCRVCGVKSVEIFLIWVGQSDLGFDWRHHEEIVFFGYQRLSASHRRTDTFGSNSFSTIRCRKYRFVWQNV